MKNIKLMIGLISISLLALAGLTALQSGNNSEAELSDTEYEIVVEVIGLHCSMCERNSRRSLEKLDQVEKATVDLDQVLAYIKIKEGHSVSQEEITEAIENSGFRTGEFKKFPGDE